MIGTDPGKVAIMALASKKVAPELKKLKQSTDGFESVFLKNLLQNMRKGIKNTSFGDKLGNDTYQDMFDQAFSDSMAKEGVLGLGEMLYKPMANKVMNQAVDAVKAAAVKKTASQETQK